MCYFVDQRRPDEPISLNQLRDEYWEQIDRGEIDPAEITFPQYIYNCMESKGGTLRFVCEEDKPDEKLFSYAWQPAEEKEDE